MSEQRTYRLFVPESDLGKFADQEGKAFKETLIDEATREQFQAEVGISQSPGDCYDKLLIQGRGGFISGDWFVKILEREEEGEDEVKVFESMRLGEGRGYMVGS